MTKKLKILLFSFIFLFLLAGGIISYSLIFSEKKVEVEVEENNSSDSSSSQPSQPSQPQPKPKPKPRPKPKTEEEEIKMFFEDLAGKYGYEVLKCHKVLCPIPRYIKKNLPFEVIDFSYPTFSCLTVKVDMPGEEVSEYERKVQKFEAFKKELSEFLKKKGFVFNPEYVSKVEGIVDEERFVFTRGEKEEEVIELYPGYYSGEEYTFYYANFKKTHLTKEAIQDIANYYIKKLNVSASDPKADSVAIEFEITNLYFDKKTNILWIELYISLDFKLNGEFETATAYGVGKIINGKYYELFDSAPYCGDLEKYRVPKEFSSNLTFECRTIRD